MSKRIMAFFLAILLLVPTTALAEGEADIVDTAVAAGNFTTLVAAVQAADLVSTLKGPGPFTVFAPTDAAFNALLEELELTAQELLASDILKDVLLYHVVPGKVMSTDLVDGASVATVGGENITVSLNPVQINDSNVVTADIQASNGVIHVVDEVLWPPSLEVSDLVDTAVELEDFSTLVAAVQKAGLEDDLRGEGPFTLFAPTDEAFADLLETLDVTAEELLNRSDLADILLYHVVSGKVMSSDLQDGMEPATLNGKKVKIALNPDKKVNDSNIEFADLEASNGVIHVIDKVLLPPADPPAEEPKEEPAPEEPPAEEPTAEEPTGEAPTADIVDTAVAAGSFTTLVAAVQKAGLVDELKGEGPFTVFAPTDDAFAALLKSLDVTAEELLNRSDLADILLYHVVKGNVLSTDLVDGMEVETLNGKKVKISLNPAMVNDSKISSADIKTTNGVIHVIDSVLLPPADEAAQTVPKTGDPTSQWLYVMLATLTGLGVLFFAGRRKMLKVRN